MKKSLLALSVSTLLFAGTHNQETDFQKIDKSDQQQIQQTQDIYISYGTGLDNKRIKITRHREDNKPLSKSEQYSIYEKSGDFKKGQKYKVIYKGDYVVKIKEK